MTSPARAPATVLHALPGRLRVHLPARSEAELRRLVITLQALPAVRSARATLLTGNVLVRFDERAMDTATLEALICAGGQHTRRTAHRGRDARAALGETGGAAAEVPTHVARPDETDHGDAIPPSHAGALAPDPSDLLREPPRPRPPCGRGLLGRVAVRDTTGDTGAGRARVPRRGGQRPGGA